MNFCERVNSNSMKEMDDDVVTPGQSFDGSSIRVIHIMVVDDDPICLAIIAGLLRTWKYDVVTVKDPVDALDTLRMKQGLIDLVVTDVHMPGMNGFELQRHVDEEFNLPVVMMSADDREAVILQGLEGGAAFFMVKPVKPNDLKNIWQYAIATRNGRARIRNANNNVNEDMGSPHGSISYNLIPNEDRESAASANEVNKVNSVTVNEVNEVVVNEPRPRRRGRAPRRENNNENREEAVENRVEANDIEVNENGVETIRIQRTPKRKVVWSIGLHNRFLNAIKQIGLERSVPKRILEYMHVPGLTRENIASHLQKYRIFLRRITTTEDGSDPKKLAERALLKSAFGQSPRSRALTHHNNVQNRPPRVVEQQQLPQQQEQPNTPQANVMEARQENDATYQQPPNNPQLNVMAAHQQNHSNYQQQPNVPQANVMLQQNQANYQQPPTNPQANAMVQPAQVNYEPQPNNPQANAMVQPAQVNYEPQPNNPQVNLMLQQAAKSSSFGMQNIMGRRRLQEGYGSSNAAVANNGLVMNSAGAGGLTSATQMYQKNQAHASPAIPQFFVNSGLIPSPIYNNFGTNGIVGGGGHGIYSIAGIENMGSPSPLTNNFQPNQNMINGGDQLALYGGFGQVGQVNAGELSNTNAFFGQGGVGGFSQLGFENQVLPMFSNVVQQENVVDSGFSVQPPPQGNFVGGGFSVQSPPQGNVFGSGFSVQPPPQENVVGDGGFLVQPPPQGYVVGGDFLVQPPPQGYVIGGDFSVQPPPQGYIVGGGFSVQPLPQGNFVGGGFSMQPPPQENVVGDGGFSVQPPPQGNVVGGGFSVQPPPPQPAFEENFENYQTGNGLGGGPNSSHLFDSINNNSSNDPLLQPLTDGFFGDFVSQQINNDQSLNLMQQVGKEVLQPGFPNNPYHVGQEINHEQEMLQTLNLNQQEAVEEGIVQNLNPDMYQTDDVLAWLDPQPNQQVDGQFVNSDQELYAMINQAGDNLFGMGI